jgi:transcriptional regulator with XRE-family HTH domain
MPSAPEYLRTLLDRLRVARERVGVSRSALEETLILGPGWIERFETSATVPTIDMVLAILSELNSGLPDLLNGLPQPDAASIERSIFAEQTANGLLINFRYSSFDAQYILPSASLDDFEVVIKTLRDGLARLADPSVESVEAIKSDSIARAFLAAVSLWPTENPSDIWWFVIYRAYCDPFNHPARFARLDFAQSWKRAGGWALEEVLVRHYSPYLREAGINLFVADSATKISHIEGLGLADRVEADKIDLVLTGDTDSGPRFFGIVNVKASFAERRTDDQPLSVWRQLLFPVNDNHNYR